MATRASSAQAPPGVNSKSGMLEEFKTIDHGLEKLILDIFLVAFGLPVAGNKSLMLADEAGWHCVMYTAKLDTKNVSVGSKTEMLKHKEGMPLQDPRLTYLIPELGSSWSVTMVMMWSSLIVQRDMSTLGIPQFVLSGSHESIVK
ncbi:hypothetical protein K4K59_009616 [Colletotrichum sp. SAR11_240]|nr:hypothetical protein K4K59_009616 [Colletotrichum sp. SAR11_240]